MNQVVGSHDLVLLVLDTLRYDVAAELASTGRTPTIRRALPGGMWERRHRPASFTYPAHWAFLTGFLPTPAEPGRQSRLFAARFPGSETTGERTWVFDGPDLVSGLAAAGYHTVCVGGVGFFNKLSPLGAHLPGLFAESHWEPSFGVTAPASFRAQVDRVERILARLTPDRRLFLLLNVSALHQPNRCYLPGATEDSPASHAAALEYVDRYLGRLFALLTTRGPCFVVACIGRCGRRPRCGRSGLGSGAMRCSSTCTCRSARCAPASATCSPVAAGR